MSFAGENLCCCEYFDVEQQRNHILACCCNCQYLDASFDNLIMGKSIPSNVRQGFLLTLQDRLRVPWYGGARRITPDVLAPILLIPATLLFATINVWWTIITFTIVFILLFYLVRSPLKKTDFFYTWTVTSTVTLFIIFEFIVVPFLEILIHENIALVLLLTTCVVSVYFIKRRTAHLKNEVETGKIQTRYCSLCHASITEGYYHCVWIDSCIGAHNRLLWWVATFSAIASLFYSANLTLTTVCHPFRVYKTILLPDDCSEVYEQFEYALSFVSAVYSTCIAVLLTLRLLYQLIWILIGGKAHRFGWINAMYQHRKKTIEQY